MNQHHSDYQVLPYAKFRRFTAAAYQSVHHKQVIHGLLAVDVTKPRAILRAYEAQTGESLSFTAFLSACLAKAVDEHKEVQAFRQGSKRLVIFDDVDIYTVIEHDVASQKYIYPYIMRKANHKSVHELHHEIRAAQAMDMSTMLQRSPLVLIPTALFGPSLRAFAWLGTQYPRLWKNTVGTVGISAVGMFGTGAGWGIPAAMPTALTLTVGGIGEQPVLSDGQVITREYLSLTISVDHDVVDGAPAARFAERLKELIEAGYGLHDNSVRSEQAPRSPKADDVFTPADSNLSQTGERTMYLSDTVSKDRLSRDGSSVIP